jgi:deoxyribonuclease (pyrimidine dimer)
MAEYRELPMVPAAARRSKPDHYKGTNKYTLNSGHVLFFYNKKKYLLDRWLDLINELYSRGFAIDPAARVVHWNALDKFPQVDWIPDQYAIDINRARIDERINQKRHWYKYRKKPLESALLT